MLIFAAATFEPSAINVSFFLRTFPIFANNATSVVEIFFVSFVLLRG